jgi:hypothetical protein
VSTQLAELVDADALADLEAGLAERPGELALDHRAKMSWPSFFP